MAYSLVQYVNQHLAGKGLHDVIAYYETLAVPCVIPRFATMQMTEAYSHSGIAISTCLATTRSLLKIPAPKRKYFYVWDLEWLRSRYAYRELCDIYRHPELCIISRSEEHADIIESAWNVKVAGIMDNFCLSDLRLGENNDG